MGGRHFVLTGRLFGNSAAVPTIAPARIGALLLQGRLGTVGARVPTEGHRRPWDHTTAGRSGHSATAPRCARGTGPIAARRAARDAPPCPPARWTVIGSASRSFFFSAWRLFQYLAAVPTVVPATKRALSSHVKPGIVGTRALSGNVGSHHGHRHCPAVRAGHWPARRA